jgi:hypothetical protein
MEARNPQGLDMAIAFNHTIIAARDRRASAAFYTELYGLPEPTEWGPFDIVSFEQGL